MSRLNDSALVQAIRAELQQENDANSGGVAMNDPRFVEAVQALLDASEVSGKSLREVCNDLLAAYPLSQPLP
jgi:hypothetical protein